MRRLVLSCLLLTGCPAPSPADAGADGGVDAPVLDGGSDAGPCGVCDTATPFCNTTTMMCVECLEATDCTGAGEAACVAGSCVACDSNDDCPAEMPQCSATNTCEACTDATACTGRPEGEICGASGACVECSADDETACGTNVCDVEAGTCTSVGMGTVGTCLPCTSNRACADGSTCVLQRFDEPPVEGTLIDVGYVCLPTAAATCTSATAPFVNREMLSDRAGDSVAVCGLRLATCPAYLMYDAEPACVTDADCGMPDVDDGLCRMAAAGMRCTTRCAGSPSDDCDPGIACNTTAPRYCCFGPTCM